MSSSALYRYLLPLLLALVSCAASGPELETAPHSATAASSGPWLQYADVRQAGFDAMALRAVCERADSLHSGALMAVFRGLRHPRLRGCDRAFEAHSVRKSLVSGLYGMAVARGEIDLNLESGRDAGCDSAAETLCLRRRLPVHCWEVSRMAGARHFTWAPALQMMIRVAN